MNVPSAGPHAAPGIVAGRNKIEAYHSLEIGESAESAVS
jgi:hypothetical protein